MSTRILTRRRFIYLSAAGALGVGGHQLARAVKKSRESAAHMADL